MDKERFGKFIAEERKSHNMTQGQFAEKVNVSTAAVSKWERSLCLPDLTKLDDIAEVLDLSLLELMQCKRNEKTETTYKEDDVLDVLHSTVQMSGNELRKNRKMIRYLKSGLCAVIVVALLLGYFLFSRPMTISQIYPMISMDQCSEITGHYGIGSQVDETAFSYDSSREEFWKLLVIFSGQEYRRSLKDIFPRTTKIHNNAGNDDIWWDVSLRFDEIMMPDGSVSSGILRFNNWYGELEIYFDGKPYACYTKDSKIYEAVFKLLSS